MTVSIITQTCVRPERADAFARWQGETSTVISNFPGFIEQRLMPPKPPLQARLGHPAAFRQPGRCHAMAGIVRTAVPHGRCRVHAFRADDVHIVRDDASAARTAPVSAVISTRVRPGMEAEYLKWEQKVAAAQSKAAGLQGYRFEPPVPGLQEDFVAILRFDSEVNLQAWLESPQRRQLLDEAAPLTAEFHTRTAQSGFEQWFRDATPEGAPAPAAWKMNMIVLLALYPVVFLWGLWVSTPILTGVLHLNFPVALFIGNAVSVIFTSYLVPWFAKRLNWWLTPPKVGRTLVDLQGASLLVATYTIVILLFWKTL